MQPISGPSVVAFLEYMRINHPCVLSLRDIRKELKDYVIKWIKEDYSPEQIIGAAKTEG